MTGRNRSDQGARGLPRRHWRFLAAFGLGVLAAGAARGLPLPPDAWMLVGVDVFFLAYLALMSQLMSLTPDEMRARAATEDEGMAVILTLALLAVGISLYGILSALHGPGGDGVHEALALAALPLGWAMLQTLAAFRYAHLFYRPFEESPQRGGLAFPGTKEPGPWDFLYFALVIGMTSQVSDVEVTDQTLRRAVMVHSVAAFLNNTVILALAVAAVAG